MHAHLRRAFLALAFLVGVLGGVPAVAPTSHDGAAPGPQDQNARTLHILQYHPFPDPEGDPWGIPGGIRDGNPVGYMEATYNAFWYPTVVVDGLTTVEGATTFREAFDRYEAEYKVRRVVDAPVRLAVMGAVDGDEARVQVEVRPKRGLDTSNATLRVVLYEDEVRFDGGNGIDLHRFTVRAILLDAPVALETATASTFNETVPLDPDWNRDHLGVVASVHNHDPSSVDVRRGEVLQAATYRFAQAGSTIQFTRGVLLEVLTATWCAACLYGDNALHELANFYGLPSSRHLDQGWTYLRPPSAGVIVLVVGAVAGGGVAAWRLHRPRGPTP